MTSSVIIISPTKPKSISVRQRVKDEDIMLKLRGNRKASDSKLRSRYTKSEKKKDDDHCNGHKHLSVKNVLLLMLIILVALFIIILFVLSQDSGESDRDSDDGSIELSEFDFIGQYDDLSPPLKSVCILPHAINVDEAHQFYFPLDPERLNKRNVPNSQCYSSVKFVPDCGAPWVSVLQDINVSEYTETWISEPTLFVVYAAGGNIAHSFYDVLWSIFAYSNLKQPPYSRMYLSCDSVCW